VRTSDLINETYRHHRRTPTPRQPGEPSRAGNVLAAGTDALVVLMLMLGSSLLLWVGLPMGTLWLGSWIQTDTDSLGLAVGTMFVVAITGVVAIGYTLAALNRRHVALRAARGLDASARVLEVVLVTSAALALGLFAVWFLLLSSPVPQAVPGIVPS
jgi:hypothetical protein